MKAKWHHVEDNTNVMNVPGGALVMRCSQFGPCMAFVPGIEVTELRSSDSVSYELVRIAPPQAKGPA